MIMRVEREERARRTASLIVEPDFSEVVVAVDGEIQKENY
jgi:hypothetical protein